MSFIFKMYIGAEPSEIWEALTKPEGTRKIYYGCVIQSEFVDGSSFAYVGPGNDGAETVHLYGDFVTVEKINRWYL